MLITFLLGLFILLGAVLARRASNQALIEQMSISVACGTMTALALLELLPEALEHMDGRLPLMAVLVAAGVGVLKWLDRFVPEHDHAHGFHHDCTEENVTHLGVISAVAVMLHNLVEGMTGYSIAAESWRMGALMALGVGLHNLPMGMMIGSTLRNEPRRKQAAFLAAAALSTFAGGVVMKLLWFAITDFVVGVLLCLALGMMIYIVLLELLPHLMHAPRKGLSAACAAVGVAIILLSGLLE